MVLRYRYAQSPDRGVRAVREIHIVSIEIDAEIVKGDNLVSILADSKQSVTDGDIIVVAQKIVSKAEGRLVRLEDVVPSSLAKGLASEYGKDARIVELVMNEAKRIVRIKNGIIITQTHHGFVCANSGVDESNAPDGYAILLPEDPDGSAKRIREQIKSKLSANVGIIISDTFGRPFRLGQTDIALGSAGIMPSQDYEGKKDTFGRTLKTTLIVTADEIAGAAELVMAKTTKCPMALVKGTGLEISDDAPGAASLVRPESEDLFLKYTL